MRRGADRDGADPSEIALHGVAVTACCHRVGILTALSAWAVASSANADESASLRTMSNRELRAIFTNADVSVIQTTLNRNTINFLADGKFRKISGALQQGGDYAIEGDQVCLKYPGVKRCFRVHARRNGRALFQSFPEIRGLYPIEVRRFKVRG